MTRRFLSLLAMLCVAMLVAGDAAYAAVTVTTSQNIAPDGGAAHDPYDPATDTPGSGPMLSASSTDIAQGLTATYMGGSDDPGYELSTGVAAWTDGSLATVYPENGPGGDAVDHAGYGTVGPNGDATFDLGGFYNLSQVDVFAGWNDSGRDAISFELQVSADDAVYSLIASYTKGPDDTGQITVPVTNLYSIADDGGADIASAVRYVRLHVTDADNGHAGVVEVDIFGTQVPEPSTCLLAGLALLGCAKLRRRR